MHLSAPVSRTAEAIDSGASTTAAVYESLGRPDYIAKVSDQGTTFYYFKIRIDTFRSDLPGDSIFRVVRVVGGPLSFA